MLFRENTVDEYIDSLSAKDLKFIRKLLKQLAKEHYFEQVKYEDGSIGYENAYQDEMIRAIIHGYYLDQRFHKENKLKVVAKRVKKVRDDIHKQLS